MSNVVMHNCNTLMPLRARIAGVFAPLIFLAACSQTPQAGPATAEHTITADSLLGEIKTLASDDFEGRKPGSPGEEKTIAWMQQQFQQMGLKPGNPNGTWLQNVPLAGVTSKSQVEIGVKDRKLALTDRKDYIALSNRYTPAV